MFAKRGATAVQNSSTWWRLPRVTTQSMPNLTPCRGATSSRTASARIARSNEPARPRIPSWTSALAPSTLTVIREKTRTASRAARGVRVQPPV